MKFLAFSQTKLRSSFEKTRAREGGASVFSLLSFLLFSVPPSCRKVLGAKPKQTGKKERGWGEGIFARSCLPFPSRLRKEKIGRAQNEKSKEYFSVVWRARRAVAGLASLLGVLLKECSNINQETPPRITFCEINRILPRICGVGMVFFRNFEGIFEIQKQRAVGNAEVRRAKLWQNVILQTNLFSFAFSERLSVFFNCPKTNLKTIWTT